MISSLLNVAYLLPIVLRAFFRPVPGTEPGEKVRIAEAPLACVVPICITAAGCIALFFFADRVAELANMIDLKATATAAADPGASPHGQ